MKVAIAPHNAGTAPACRTSSLLAVLPGIALLALAPPLWAQDATAAADAVGDAAASAIDCAQKTAAQTAASEAGKQMKKALGRFGLKVPTPASATTDPCAPGATAASAPVPAVKPVAMPAPAKGMKAATKGGRNCGALGTTCADGMSPLVACQAEKDGWLWKNLADAIEAKHGNGTNLPGDQRTALGQDVAALRAAHVAGAPRVEVVDPSRPSRYNDWLTPEEYSVTATRVSQELNAHTQACNDKHAKF